MPNDFGLFGDGIYLNVAQCGRSLVFRKTGRGDDYAGFSKTGLISKPNLVLLIPPKLTRPRP